MAKICKDHLGNVYPSITKMCDFYGIPVGVYKSRKHQGWSIEKSLTIPNGAITPNAKQVTDHLGNVFPSITDMCNFYAIPYHLYTRRKHLGWSLERSLITPIGVCNNTKQVTDHLGNEFSSITAMCKFYKFLTG